MIMGIYFKEFRNLYKGEKSEKIKVLLGYLRL